MAIVRSQDGTFYEIDDAVLEGRALPQPAEAGPGKARPPAAGIVRILIDTGGGNRPGAPSPPPSATPASRADVQGHNRCSWRNCGWQNWRNWRNSF